MATRSKKFDKFTGRKVLCFLLAVLLAFCGCAFTLWQAATLAEAETNTGSFVTDVLRGVKSTGEDVPKMTAFRSENTTLQSLAVQRYLFGDGSKEAYEAYQKNRENVYSGRTTRLRKTILENCKGESGRGSPAAIFTYLPQSIIHLRKLGAHDSHFVIGGLLRADSSGLRFETVNEGNYYVYEFDSDDFYDDDSNPTELETTMYDVVTDPQSVGGDVDYQSRNAIPKKIKNQLRDGEIAVELCNTQFRDGNIYDGYYALSVNETILLSRYSEPRTNYGSAFSSFAEFQNAFENLQQLTNAYKNLTFAVVDNKTGVAVSNVSALDGKKLSKDDLRVFTKAKWNYKADLLQNDPFGSNLILSDAAQHTNETEPIFLNVVSGELNATLYVAFDQTLSKTDVFSQYPMRLSVVSEKIGAVLLADAVCLLGILLCVIYLVLHAGRRYGDPEVHLLKTDRIFTLLRTALNLGAAAGLGGVAVAVFEELINEGVVAAIFLSLAGGLCAAGIAALGLDWLLFLARHIKNGTLFSNFFAVWLWKKSKVIYQKRKAALAAKPKVLRDLLNDILRRVLLMGFLPNFLLGLLIVIVTARGPFEIALFLIFMIFAYDVFLAFYICRYAYHLRTVIAAVHQVRNGELHVQIDTSKMPPAVKAFADDVTELQRGLQTAVENAIRDERTKTELITNVSHDLKTPLTSIINYVDLLRRCNIPDETAQGYLDVLGEKSDRLKKLIEDLVEASKASAGAVKVSLTVVSLGELARQLLGEYADAFEERGLSVIFQQGDAPLRVCADSKLSYRVLDNLMGNIKKYAMPGTRVYLTLSQTADRGVLTLRNVSQEPLGIPVEELRERFVRGDRARSTEGSGLGLSIAEDLCRLQNAKLDLSIDGDLFTASVAFVLAKD